MTQRNLPPFVDLDCPFPHRDDSLRTPRTPTCENLLRSAVEPWNPKSAFSTNRIQNRVEEDTVPWDTSDPQPIDEGLTKTSTASDSAGTAALAAFVIGEVRDHLRDIHLEISALRSRLDDNAQMVGRRSHLLEMVSTGEDRRESISETTSSEKEVFVGDPEASTFATNRRFYFGDDAAISEGAEGCKQDSVKTEPFQEETLDVVRGLRGSAIVNSVCLKKERLDNLYLNRVRSSGHSPQFWVLIRSLITSIVTSFMKRRLPTRRLERFMELPRVRGLVILLVCLNCLYLGIYWNLFVEGAVQEYYQEQRINERKYMAPGWTDTANQCFSVVFLFDLVLRLLGQECRFFFGLDWKWNIFDFVVELLGLVDILFVDDFSANQAVFLNLRLLRIARTLRAIRILKYVPWMSELRFMSLAIMNSVMPLFWACLVLIVFLFVTAMTLVQGVADYVLSAPQGSREVQRLEEYFDSVWRTMLTLFMSMTGGVDWREAFDALETVHSFYGALFVLFIACSALAVLNIITSIFVTDAIEVAQKDLDFRMRGELKNSRKVVEELTKIFAQMDEEGHGMVTSDILVKCLDSSEVRAQFALLGLEITDAVSFFRVLDVDAGGYVDISEFVMGCLRLKGHAHLVDLEVSILEIKRMLQTAVIEQRSLATHLSMVRA